MITLCESDFLSKVATTTDVPEPMYDGWFVVQVVPRQENALP
jgi:hypothetical protein